jgi:hypothetical protein
MYLVEVGKERYRAAEGSREAAGVRQRTTDLQEEVGGIVVLA